MAQCTSILAVAALLGALASGARVSMPEIIAHRGASFDAPENTVAAFKLAWQQNADGIEGDFRLTRDGKLICSHDATTKRVGDKDLEVAKSTFDELRQVDVGAKKGAAWKGERMPSIDEALAVVQPGKKIYIEIYNPQSVPILRQSIERSSLRPEQTVIISFDRKTVAAAKEGLPKLKAYWLVDLKKDKAAGLPNRGAEEIVSVLKEIRADGVDCRRKRCQEPFSGKRENAPFFGDYAEKVPDTFFPHPGAPGLRDAVARGAT